jgi:hypothetical protein
MGAITLFCTSGPRSNYLRVASAWRSHLTTFLGRPSLRPYFEAGKQLNDDNPNRESVLAIADERLEVMDDILDYASLAGMSDQIGDWKRTFAAAFISTPAPNRQHDKCRHQAQFDHHPASKRAMFQEVRGAKRLHLC